MPTALWIVLVVMTVVAVLILARPFVAHGQKKQLYATIVGVPVFAFAVYFAVGSPGLESFSSRAAVPGTAATDPMAGRNAVESVGSVASLVDGLADRLVDNPDDADGWLLLAKSYNYLGRQREALDAYARAVDLGQFDAGLDALANGGGNIPQPANADESGAVVSGVVSLSETTAALVEPTDTVFIFARAPGQAGAPAAVLQQSAAALPISFRLTDAQSMVEGNALSNFDTVVVTARISRSGNAANALHGLEARSGPVAVNGGEPVDLILE